MARVAPSIVVLTVAGVIFGGQALSHAAVGATEYTVVIKKVEVKKTNKNGDPWDVNDGKPDLCVVIRNTTDKEQKAFESKVKDDVYAADFNEVTTLKVKEGQVLEFRVLDKDVAAHDEIGKTNREITGKILKEGTLRMENFDQVIFLEIELKKL